MTNARPDIFGFGGCENPSNQEDNVLPAHGSGRNHHVLGRDDHLDIAFPKQVQKAVGTLEECRDSVRIPNGINDKR